MAEKKLKINNIRVKKKTFHISKEPIDLFSVNIDQIVISDKFNHNEDGFKYFVGYQKDENLKPLCISLSQMSILLLMSGYIKYVKYESPNMSFLIKYDKVWEKYKQIWDAIKNKLKIQFHSLPVYTKKYLKTKVREHDGMMKINFLGNHVP